MTGDRVFSGAVRKVSNARSLSSPDFKHFNKVLWTICIVLSTMPFGCANSGLLVSYSKSQFADNFLNSNEVNSGPLSEKTSLGFHILRTLLSSSLSLLVRCCWGVCWFQNTWNNSPQERGWFSPIFWRGPYRLLSKVCQESHGSWVVQHFDGFYIISMPHNLISYLLCQHSCLARRVIVWPVFSIPRWPWCRIL